MSGDSIQDNINQTVDSAGEVLSNTGERIQNAIPENVRQQAGEIRESLQGTYHNVTESSQSSGFSETLNDVVEYVREAISHAWETGQEFVQENFSNRGGGRGR